MILGYNTNGLANHDVFDAVALLADLGYAAVGVTIDHGVVSPRDPAAQRQAERLREAAAARGMTLVVETGARFLLDPCAKHEPTLVSPAAARRAERVAFYRWAIDAAGWLGAGCVSVWSGVVHDGAEPDEVWRRMVEGLAPTLDYADRAGVSLAFEPEPGMYVATVADFFELKERLGGASARIGVTLDIGHLVCNGEPLAESIARCEGLVRNVHLDDMRRGVHDHLPFGEGDVDIPRALGALAEIGYDGVTQVELSRHSHEGPDAARRAYGWLATRGAWRPASPSAAPRVCAP